MTSLCWIYTDTMSHYGRTIGPYDINVGYYDVTMSSLYVTIMQLCRKYMEVSRQPPQQTVQEPPREHLATKRLLDGLQEPVPEPSRARLKLKYSGPNKLPRPPRR